MLARFPTMIRRLAEALTLPKTTDILVEEARHLTGASAAHALLVQPDGTLRDPLGATPPSTALDAARSAIQARAPARAEPHLALPLVVRNRALGALVLEAPTNADPALGDLLALHAALALDRATLHDDEDQHRAELEASEARFRSLVQELDAVFWECDATTFQFSFVSQRAEKLLGYPTHKWRQPGFWASILHPDDQHWALTFCAECTKEGRDHAFEYRMTAADGRTLWFRDVVYVLRDAEGKPSKLRGVMIDITALRQGNAGERVAKRLGATTATLRPDDAAAAKKATRAAT